MPAGDVGLERNHGPLCLARAEHDRLRTERDELRAQLAAMQSQLVIRGPYCALHGEHQPCSQHRWGADTRADAGLEQSSVTLLPDTYSALYAVVERAREVLNCIDVDCSPGWDHWSGGGCLVALDDALIAFDKAQAAQPEGER